MTLGLAAGGLTLAGGVLSRYPWRSVDGYIGHAWGVQLLALISVAALAASVVPISAVAAREPSLTSTECRSSTPRAEPIDVADLGVTLMHEHVFIMTTEIMENYPEGWGDGAKREADAIARLNELKSRGVDTIVDLTVVGLGRYIPRIARIAAATELNIVVATGLYTYNDVPMYFHYLGPGAVLGGPETMVDMFVRDIEHGIADTGVKAAILKCATDEPGVTPGVERVLRAVAQAHRQTGVPISTHTHAATRRGLEQQRIFAEEGVDLSRVVIGHSGDTTDIAYLEELIARGLLPRHGPVRGRRVPGLRGPGRTPWPRCASGATPTRWCCRTTPPATSTRSRGDTARRAAELALPAHPRRRHSRAETARASPTSSSPPCWWTTRARSSRPGAGTDVVTGFAPISTQVSALAAADPDAPAVTCEGRTLTRAELDASTNRLARAYAELGRRHRRLRVDRDAQLDRLGPVGARVLEAGRRAAAVVGATARRRVRRHPGPACRARWWWAAPTRAAWRRACPPTSCPTPPCPTHRCPRRCRRCGSR